MNMQRLSDFPLRENLAQIGMTETPSFHLGGLFKNSVASVKDKQKRKPQDTLLIKESFIR